MLKIATCGVKANGLFKRQGCSPPAAAGVGGGECLRKGSGISASTDSRSEGSKTRRFRRMKDAPLEYRFWAASPLTCYQRVVIRQRAQKEKDSLKAGLQKFVCNIYRCEALEYRVWPASPHTIRVSCLKRALLTDKYTRGILSMHYSIVSIETRYNPN